MINVISKVFYTAYKYRTLVVMTTPKSIARGCSWGWFIPPTAMATRLLNVRWVLTSGNVRTSRLFIARPKTLDVLPSSDKSQKKSSYFCKRFARKINHWLRWRHSNLRHKLSCKGLGSAALKEMGELITLFGSIEARRVRLMKKYGCD